MREADTEGERTLASAEWRLIRPEQCTTCRVCLVAFSPQTVNVGPGPAGRLTRTQQRRLTETGTFCALKEYAQSCQRFTARSSQLSDMILMGELKLGVEEACSGMRMLTVFVAISAATMIVCQRSAWEKVVILLSAIPIALICNIGRIVATALAHNWFGQSMADLVFHDLSGWLMMPSAMALLYLLLKLLDWLFIAAPEAEHRLRPVVQRGLPGMPRMAKTR